MPKRRVNSAVVGMCLGIGLAAGAVAQVDPPCFDNETRFVNCGNGTVTDTVTGVIWLFNADCFGRLSYAAANDAAATLGDGQCGLTDGSRPGDWRLATREEWEALVDPACPMPRLVGNGRNCSAARCCFPDSPWADGVRESQYWSSTSSHVLAAFAWGAFLDFGTVGRSGKPGFNHAWPVRDGK